MISEKSSAKPDMKEKFLNTCDFLVDYVDYSWNKYWKSNFENLSIQSYQCILLLVKARELKLSEIKDHDEIYLW